MNRDILVALSLLMSYISTLNRIVVNVRRVVRVTELCTRPLECKEEDYEEELAEKQE